MKILIDKDRIQTRITEMALEIDSYYYKRDWYRHSQEPLVVIGVLTGAVFFMADLVRKLSIRTELDFIRVSTYPGKSTTAQKPKIITPSTNLPNGAHVLLVDDILDTGKTIKTIRKYFWHNWIFPEDMRTAVLLRKARKAIIHTSKREKDVTADFVGFDIPDKFVVGYGLDYNGRYRELPCVAVWSENEFGTGEKEVN